MINTGMLCPKCKGATTVYDTRHKPDGSTKRNRECLCCGFRFRTVEKVAVLHDSENIMKGGVE